MIWDTWLNHGQCGCSSSWLAVCVSFVVLKDVEVASCVKDVQVMWLGFA